MAPKDGDGYERAVNSVRRERSKMLSVDALTRAGRVRPRDLERKTFAIEYEDAAGDQSTRWVTISSVKDDHLGGYCWAAKSPRSFRIDRIIELYDGDGEVLSGDEFRALLAGKAQPRVPMPKANETAEPARLTRKQRRDIARAEVTQRVRDEAAAARHEAAAARRVGKTQSEPSETPDISTSLPSKTKALWTKIIVWSTCVAFLIFGFIDGGFDVGFGLIFMLGNIAFVVGLIWPYAILPFSWRRRRMTVVYMYLGLIFALFTAVALLPPVPGPPE